MATTTEADPWDDQPAAPATSEADPWDDQPAAPATSEADPWDDQPAAPATSEADPWDDQPAAPATSEADPWDEPAATPADACSCATEWRKLHASPVAQLQTSEDPPPGTSPQERPRQLGCHGRRPGQPPSLGRA